MNWQWLISEGLIEGDLSYYEGNPSAEDISNAVRVAYLNSNDSQRKVLVDMLWETGSFTGEASYWYSDRKAEVADLASAATGIGAVDRGEGARMSIPGGAELWKVGNEDWLVYMVPGTDDDPVYMVWKSPSAEDTQSFFGPDKAIVYQRRIEASDPLATEAIQFGSTSELANTDKNPFDGWEQTLATEALTQPWILDEDYQSIIAMAALEGRSPTQAEIAQTGWWKNNTAKQRQYMEDFNFDPATAAQTQRDQYEITRQQLTAAGMGQGTPDNIIQYMANQLLTGSWSQVEYNQQLQAISDPASGQVVDPSFQAVIGDTGLQTTMAEEDTVRTLLSTWLGPSWGDWDDSEISRVAGLLRNDPNYKQSFIEQLKDSRMAVMPAYTDRNQSYSAIANVWKQQWYGQYGEMPDEHSDLWREYVGMNDSTGASRLLRKTGLAEGNEKVLQDASKQTMQAMGSSVRGAI